MAESTHQTRPGSARVPLTRGRSNFVAGTATNYAGELFRRASLPPTGPIRDPRPQSVDVEAQHRQQNDSAPDSGDGANDNLLTKDESNRETSRRRSDPQARNKRRRSKTGINGRTDEGSNKLGMVAGVFVPTSLNVLSILMFIRFGFILGQTGLLGMLILLVAAYIINLVTTLSISAVASNGRVKGGGAYYLISRCLGPEFGGAIGIVSYIGFVLNTGMNAVGLVDCLIYNFGADSGIWAQWLPETGWWPYLWSTIVVILCVALCLAGSAIFAKASNWLLFILLVSVVSIPISALVLSPFEKPAGLRQYTHFTGWSAKTTRENFLPRFTRGAAGSQIHGKETWSDMFGILFPATGGIFAGASMSGDLKKPSRSIPQGTLYGLVVTFVCYAVVIVAMAASITRDTFYKNVNVVQDVNMFQSLVLCGEVATTAFSVLMGIIGPAKQLQAIARDSILPGIGKLGEGSAKNDDPFFAIMFTWAVAQVTILFDINRIAAFVTMGYLVLNLALHMACLLLKLTSAPNFRPSFRFFNQWTALFGAVISLASMFFVDAVSASISICVLLLLIILIHFTTSPKSWGADVTSGLVYHQIRKYLLRLKTEDVKYWRPQILLLINDPRRSIKLIKFANHLKKGGLFILGHVIVTDNFDASVKEVKKQQAAYKEFINKVKLKSFVNVNVATSVEWGARNIFLSSGLGGMRPNIVMMGFYNLQQYREEQPLVDIPSPPPERVSGKVRKRRLSGIQINGTLPTDACYVEKRTDLQSYVLVLEDYIMKLKTNVAVACGFSDLELPEDKLATTKKYIDLWPIQMSAVIPTGQGDLPDTHRTTNLDTETLILQFGYILNSVPAWKRRYTLRVLVFTEYESEVEEQRAKIATLLEDLRISAEIHVFWLARGDLKTYQYIVNGVEVDDDTQRQVNSVLEDDKWWQQAQKLRGKVRSGEITADDVMSLYDEGQFTPASMPNGLDNAIIQSEALRRLLQRPRHRSSFGNLSNLGIVPRMRTYRLNDDLLSKHASRASSDSGLEASDEEDYEDAELDDSYHDELSSIHGDEETTQSASTTNLRSPKSKSTSGRASRKSSRRSSRKGSKKSSRASSRVRKDTEADLLVETEQDLLQFASDEANSGSERGRRQYRNDSQTVELGISPMNQGGNDDSPSANGRVLPQAQIDQAEAAGPSIMFADDPHPRYRDLPTQSNQDGGGRSIYVRGNDESSPSKMATGVPAGAAIPMSFDTLEVRGQHLIINELISQTSDDTAVTFMTLPAPTEGAYKSESSSLQYLTELEVLLQGLGPVLLVHSNSMTVTTNL